VIVLPDTPIDQELSLVRIPKISRAVEPGLNLRLGAVSKLGEVVSVTVAPAQLTLLGRSQYKIRFQLAAMTGAVLMGVQDWADILRL
jgi:hypothetical protein